MKKTFAALNSKGGVGKTTLLANIGGLLADMGARVLLVDADPQPSLTKYFELTYEAPQGLVEVVTSGTVTHQAISRTSVSNLDLVRSNDGDAQLQHWLYTRDDRRVRLARALSNPYVRDHYDYVLIDTQGAIGPLQTAAAFAADTLISPLPPDTPSIREFRSGTLKVLQRLEHDAEEPRAELAPIQAVICRFDYSRDAKTLLNVQNLLALLTEGRAIDADAGNWLDAGMAEALFGRGFAWHTVLGRLFPLHTAMLCSRLLAGVRWPLTQDPQAPLRFIGLSRSAWTRETGLSRDQWQTARRNLREAGILVERQRNFPRRVDLALNLAELASVVRSGLPVRPARPGQPYRQDRAILVSGIGHRPIPPMQSPDPAFKDLPIPPAGIARSRLQLLQLQVIQLPPQLSASTRVAAWASPVPAFGWGGGGGYEMAGRPEEGQPVASQAGVAVPEEPRDKAARLHWPSCFTKSDQAGARQHLKNIAAGDRQLLLDEIAWIQSTSKGIRSPLALLRVLAIRLTNGSFTPDGAHRVAEAREHARQAAVAEQAARSEQASQGKPQFSGPSPEVKERMRRILGRGGLV